MTTPWFIIRLCRENIEIRAMKQQKKKSAQFFMLFLFLLFAFSPSCRLYNLQRKLPPNYADFLSKVRYIISRSEERTFLELPDSKKDQFIEQFWKRRDSDPETEENEFKMNYFKRIEDASRLFSGEGRAGWLTDRGRIYIFFGPPLDRITSPMGEGPSSRCSEVWYYGDFPVLFLDSTCTGGYKLVTYNLTPLRDINLAYMHELNRAEAQARAEAQGQESSRKKEELFDFTWEVEKRTVEPGRIEGTIRLAIPYSAIWFKSEQELFKTELEMALELRDAAEELQWEYKDAFEIAIKKEELKEKQKAFFSREIPFILENNLEKLRRGKNTFRLRLKNLTGNEESQKELEISF